MPRIIKLNSARCLICNQILVSRSVHDYVTCKCGNLSIDGGNEYIKVASNDYTKVESLHMMEYSDKYDEDGDRVFGEGE